METTVAEARQRTLDAVREAFAGIDGAEAEAIAAWLLRTHEGRDFATFPHPGRRATSSVSSPATEAVCVARFARLPHASRDPRAEVVFVDRIETI